MMNYDMGFDKENLFNASIPVENSNKEAFMDELLKQHAIKDIAWADGPIVSAFRMGWGRELKDEKISFQCYPVSYNFLKFMGIQIVEGRDFTVSDEMSLDGVFIFNEKAKREFNMSLDDKIIGHKRLTSIAGFCEDFQFKPLQYQISPFAFYIMGKEAWRIQTYLYIRSNAGVTFKEVEKAVKNVVASIYEKVFIQETRVLWYRNYTRHTNTPK